MKPKNIRSAPIFTSILLCSSILTGCAREADITTLSESSATVGSTSETTTITTTEETTTSSVEDVPDEVLEQIQIIYDNYDVWKLQTETDTDLSEADGLSSPLYAVTDLDNDGMLEIMKTGFAGSGVYSRNIFYEVTEDGELELLNEEFWGDLGGPDLWNHDAYRYYTDEDGTRWYLTQDYCQSGVSYWQFEYSCLSVADGYTYVPYCYEEFSATYDEESDSCIEEFNFYDGDRNEITEEEFDQITAEYEDMAEGESVIGWIPAKSGDELVMPSMYNLIDSYRTFEGL